MRSVQLRFGPAGPKSQILSPASDNPNQSKYWPTHRSAASLVHQLAETGEDPTAPTRGPLGHWSAQNSSTGALATLDTTNLYLPGDAENAKLTALASETVTVDYNQQIPIDIRDWLFQFGGTPHYQAYALESMSLLVSGSGTLEARLVWFDDTYTEVAHTSLYTRTPPGSWSEYVSPAVEQPSGYPYLSVRFIWTGVGGTGGVVLLRHPTIICVGNSV
jgi:hypothetical protein